MSEEAAKDPAETVEEKVSTNEETESQEENNKATEETQLIPKQALDREIQKKWENKRLADAAEARAQVAEAQLAELQRALRGEQDDGKSSKGERTYTAAEVAEFVRQ